MQGSIPRLQAGPPADAPLRVNLEDGGVLRVIILHFRVGELSAVDVYDNGGAARALPRGCQAPDLSGIPPGGVGGRVRTWLLKLCSKMGSATRFYHR